MHTFSLEEGTDPEGSFSHLVFKSRAISYLFIWTIALDCLIVPEGGLDRMGEMLCSFSLLGSSQWKPSGFSAPLGSPQNTQGAHT